MKDKKPRCYWCWLKVDHAFHDWGEANQYDIFKYMPGGKYGGPKHSDQLEREHKT